MRAILAGNAYPWRDDDTDVDFPGVVERMLVRPLAPGVRLDAAVPNPLETLTEVVTAASAGLVEMLIQERHRIWNLHAITGPAAVGFLLPDVDAAGAQTLVEHARQAAIALFAAYGAPFRAGAHARSSAPAWPELVQQAIDSRYVHTIKLIDALQRFSAGDDLQLRSAAIQWMEWV